MFGLTTSFMDSYTNFMDTNSHPRTANWFLVKSFTPLFTILVSYVYFCKYAGPRYMRDRKPFQLKNVIIFYNAFQVIGSAYLVYEGLNSGWLTSYNLSCQPVIYEDTPEARRMESAAWIYFMMKLIELLDTVFFVLRKKMNQVSYLHVYHHTIMPVCAWIGVTFLANGHGTLLGVINSFIHIIMYAYYMVSSMGPEYQKYLWWKRHLTSLQLIQFCIVFVHNIVPLVFLPSCSYPKIINFLLTAQAAYFFYLFGRFYYKSYIHNKSKDHKTLNGKQINMNGFKNGTTDQCTGKITKVN